MFFAESGRREIADSRHREKKNDTFLYCPELKKHFSAQDNFFFALSSVFCG
jgi:hypothetical protein